MMRPAVITDEISQDFERSLDVMLEYGVLDAELRGLWGANILDLAPADLLRARKALETRGMRVCAIASPVYKCNLYSSAENTVGPPHLARERTLEQQLTLLERAIQLSEYFNTKLIRVFAFWKQRPADSDVMRDIVEALRPGVELAERSGVTLGLENEHACILGTGAETAGIIRKFRSPGIQAVWDPGNAFFAGEEPFPTGYRALRGQIAHVHVKDARIGRDGLAEWCVVGQGQIDFEGQLIALLEDGYQGILSLETHYKPPSGDAEEGSRQSLEGLTRLMRKLGAWESGLVS